MGRTYFDLTESDRLYIARNEALISQRKVCLYVGITQLLLVKRKAQDMHEYISCAKKSLDLRV